MVFLFSCRMKLQMGCPPHLQLVWSVLRSVCTLPFLTIVCGVIYLVIVGVLGLVVLCNCPKIYQCTTCTLHFIFVAMSKNWECLFQLKHHYQLHKVVCPNVPAIHKCVVYFLSTLSSPPPSTYIGWDMYGLTCLNSAIIGNKQFHAAKLKTDIAQNCHQTYNIYRLYVPLQIHA